MTGGGESRLRLRDGLLAREVDADLILYDPATDQAVHLNPTAAVILELCDGTRTRREIVEQAAACFDHDREQVARDVENALARLEHLGVLEQSGAGSSP